MHIISLYFLKIHQDLRLYECGRPSRYFKSSWETKRGINGDSDEICCMFHFGKQQPRTSKKMVGYDCSQKNPSGSTFVQVYASLLLGSLHYYTFSGKDLMLKVRFTLSVI